MTASADVGADSRLEQGFRLGRILVDPNAGEVCGPGGREKLDPRVMDVLMMLARNAGHVVLREDLLARLWPGAVVTEDVLSRCIYELRRQFVQAGGDAQLKLMIDTVPKRGYRLNATVVPVTEPAETAPQRLPTRLIVGVAIAVLAAVALGIVVSLRTGDLPPASASPNSIAVLPFVDMSVGQDQGYFADGIAEEILNRLAKAGGLRVISRTSSFAFRDRAGDLPEIAAALNVSHVLEGSIRRSGDQVRITAQLIAASDNSHVWSETYDRQFGELFAVQDEIAGSVASALRVELAGRGAGAATPANPEAYELFLQGQFFYNRRSQGDIDRAARYYQRALEADPGFARAWAALAGVYNLLIFMDEANEDRYQSLQGQAAQRAVELAPDLAVAHARLGQYYYAVSDPGRGDFHARQAMLLDPEDPLVMGFSGDDLMRRGNVEQAVEIWRRLVEKDPLSPINRGNLAAFLATAGRFEESVAESRHALDLNPDGNWAARHNLVNALILLRRIDEAYTEILQLPEGEARDYGLALLHQAPGHVAEADAALNRMAARPANTEEVSLADVYAHRGMIDEAFESLGASQDAMRRPADGKRRHRRLLRFFQMEMLRSPFLKALHSDPRWAELLAEPPPLADG